MTVEAAVVIVNHDTRDELVACLRSLETAGARQVVVVDCGSTDGSVAAARAAAPDAEILDLPNLGFGGGANRGVAATSTPAVVVANADTRFTPGSVAALARALELEAAVGAVGPRVTYPDGRPQASARRFPTWRQALGHAAFGLWWPDNPWTRAYRMRDLDPDVARDVDWVSGCVAAFRRTAFDQVGGFDPGYFLYVEDVDLAYRLRQSGWRIRYDPAALVEHRVGASTGEHRARMVVAHARSLDRFYGRVYGRGAGRLLRPLVRVALAVWVGVVVLWQRAAAGRAGRSSTGE